MSDRKITSEKYRIDPDFVQPEPTAATMHSFCALADFTTEEHRRVCDWMRKKGARQMRVTVVSDEYPHPPYPHGYYWEGWTGKKARQLPFGEAESADSAISPPIRAEKP